jgi:hypothetical protein
VVLHRWLVCTYCTEVQVFVSFFVIEFYVLDQEFFGCGYYCICIKGKVIPVLSF